MPERWRGGKGGRYGSWTIRLSNSTPLPALLAFTPSLSPQVSPTVHPQFAILLSSFSLLFMRSLPQASRIPPSFRHSANFFLSLTYPLPSPTFRYSRKPTDCTVQNESCLPNLAKALAGVPCASLIRIGKSGFAFLT